MVIMKDTNVTVDLNDTEVAAGVGVRTSETNGSAPPPSASAALAAAAAAASASSGAGGGNNNNVKENSFGGGGGGGKPEKPNVTFDPNPTILLTNSGKVVTCV